MDSLDFLSRSFFTAILLIPVETYKLSLNFKVPAKFDKLFSGHIRTLSGGSGLIESNFELCRFRSIRQIGSSNAFLDWFSSGW